MTSPLNPQLESQDNVLRAMIDFINICAVPPLELDCIFLGYNNDLSLPKENDDFAVVYLLNSIRHGTGITEFDSENERRIIKEYHEHNLQIDFYSTNQFDARTRAQNCSTLARTDVGVNFFRQFNLDCLSSNPLQNMSGLLDAQRYVSRYTLQMQVGQWHKISIDQDFFEKVDLRIENVDVHHKA